MCHFHIITKQGTVQFVFTHIQLYDVLKNYTEYAQMYHAILVSF